MHRQLLSSRLHDLRKARSLALLVLFLYFSAPIGLSAEVFLSDEDALKLAFPGEAAFEKKRIVVTADKVEAIKAQLRMNKRFKRIFRYYEGKKGDQLLGYAVIDEVFGKSRPITYMLVVNPDLSIRFVEILAYRESHGGEIKREGFRKQFVGKTADDPIRNGEDIKNISGATISCRSLSDGIKNKMAYFAHLFEAQKGDKASSASVEGAIAAIEIGEPRLYKRMRYQMGTALELKLFASSDAHAERAFAAAFGEVERLEALLSSYRPRSEVSRFNKGETEISNSPDLYRVLEEAVLVSRLSQGAFDITGGPLFGLWSAHLKKQEWPSKESIDKSQSLTGWEKLALDSAQQSVRKQEASLQINLGGIGKGYALDRAAEKLEGLGISAALFNFGGQLFSLGPPPGEVGWPVAIVDPNDRESLLNELLLAEGAISTSADDQRGIEYRGMRYSHIINPRTGFPATGFSSVTVKHSKASMADALSTAIFASGWEPGKRLAEQIGAQTWFYASNGAEHFYRPIAQ